MTSSPGGARLYVQALIRSTQGRISLASVGAIAAWGLLLVFGVAEPWAALPMMAASVVVAIPLARDVVVGLVHRRVGADVLALIAMATAALLGEWLVAAVIATMVSGGAALEAAASARASAVLDALARRSPTIAHRRSPDLAVVDVPIAEVVVGDVLVVLPHEICPVDGIVLEGTGAMDESFLTGEPYVVPKAPGSAVLSGAVNSIEALVVRCDTPTQDSRYSRIVDVLRKAEAEQPPMRRLADRIGLAYTVIALVLASAGWIWSGEPERFLAVLVIATPCPLLIGVPVAIIGAIALAARHGIIVKDPAMLERVSRARTMIFDKTGTLTYGKPSLSLVSCGTGMDEAELLALVGSIERYSRHPLAIAVVMATEGVPVRAVERVAERPGEGLVGVVSGREVVVTGRANLGRTRPELLALLPDEAAGLECVVLVDGEYAGTMQFRDEPREGARDFISHLGGGHGVVRTMMLSGDRGSEVAYLAERVGIETAMASVSPEEKLAIVRQETSLAPTVFLGDGINDAPAMSAATVGVAFGAGNDITAESADAVVLDSSLERLDELLHIGRRLRRIALQTAIGGIVLSGIGMILAVLGLLPPVAGAVMQEAIDLLAILNAARVPFARRSMADFRSPISPIPPHR